MSLSQKRQVSSPRLGLGIIGCGARMIDLLGPLLTQNAEHIHVAAVCDPHPASIQAARDHLRRDVDVVATPTALARRSDVDWVAIGSWNSQHPDHVEAVVDAGKHLFCEKPLAIDAPGVRRIATCLRRHQGLFVYGLTLRFSPFYRAVRACLQHGDIGRIVSLEFNETLPPAHGGYIMRGWRRQRVHAGPHILEKCCHDVDLLHWFTGAEVQRVASFGGQTFFLPENSDAEGGYNDWPALDPVDPFQGDADIVDNQVAIIELDSGVRATFHTNLNAAIPERRFYILGTRGTLRADVLTGRIEVGRIGESKREVWDIPEGRGGHGGGDFVLRDTLQRAMLEGIAPNFGIEEAVRSSLTCLAIDESRQKNIVVTRADADTFDEAHP
ncbi:MAG: Gfo/Idh/MocA family oxidoreductase [Myxococcota bacterium]